MTTPFATIAGVLLLAAGVIASPAAAPAPTAAPKLSDALVKRNASSCTFSGSDGYLSASASKTACATIVLSSLTVPSGVTLNLENLNDGTKVIFEGRTIFEFAEWEGSLVSVSGNKITVQGAPNSSLDGQGALYWDGMGNAGGKTKPKFFKANHLNDSILEGITIRNAPRNSFSLNYVNNLTVRNITVDDSTGDALGKNTDGFNINNADGVFITGVSVWNQDDCMNVNIGKNIKMTDSFCSGGHGLSIGSVANGASVQNVTYENIVMEKSQQSVRIKTVSGANATVDGITYRNIKMSGGDEYGILVDQSYGGEDDSPTNGVKITNFVLQNVTGTVESDAINILVQCGVGTCSNWSWTDVSVTGGKNSTKCMNVPAGISC